MSNFRRISTGIALLILVGAVTLGGIWSHLNPAPPAAEAFVNGTILTLDDQNSVAEAVLIRDGKIAALGSTAAITEQAGDAVVHDLGGKVMMPGIIDAHGHFPGSGVFAVGTVDLNSPPIGPVKTMDDLVARLAEAAQNTPKGEQIFGIGYDDTQLAEKRHPTAADLDRASTDHPIFIMHISGHMGVLNSAGLAANGITADTPSPPGGEIIHDAAGNPTGLLMETAVVPVRDAAIDFPLLDSLTILKAAADEYAEKGVTTAQNGLTKGKQLDAIVPGARLGLLPIRLVLFPDGEEAVDRIAQGYDYGAIKADRLHLGAMKLVGDGSLQGYTGYLTNPYHVAGPGRDAAYRGYPIYKPERLHELMASLADQGFRLAIHGNGDAAIDDMLDGLEKLRAAGATLPDPPLIIIHSQTIRMDQLDRAAKLGASPSFFSGHIHYWGDRHKAIFLGPERAERIVPAASAQARGIRFSLHLDTPVVPMTPWLLVHAAVNRRTHGGQILGPQEAISVTQALRAITIDAAWQVGLDDMVGSVEIGKAADLIVLDRDPRADPAGVRDTKVLRTLVGGVTIYSNAK